MKRGGRQVPRPSYDWWDEAVEVATLSARLSGQRHRVRWIGGPRPWQVVPATLRDVSEVCS